MSTIPTHIDVQELSDEGYIAEANRLFFHPLGLALERSTGWQDEDVQQVCEELGLGAHEIVTVVRFLKHLGLDRPHLTGVWDYRDDPEGIIYGPDHIDIATAAHQRIVELWRERQDARVEALGYMIQPVPGERADEVWAIHGEPPIEEREFGDPPILIRGPRELLDQIEIIPLPSGTADQDPPMAAAPHEHEFVGIPVGLCAGCRCSLGPAGGIWPPDRYADPTLSEDDRERLIAEAVSAASG